MVEFLRESGEILAQEKANHNKSRNDALDRADTFMDGTPYPAHCN
jgi:hypothetical protein